MDALYPQARTPLDLVNSAQKAKKINAKMQNHTEKHTNPKIQN